ncbi:MAG TPA: hypothetical protein VNF47_00610 [Streptosporangiaceae bacterium]|nr:hypothetical protein [Streptosporangiaceae bacterium]
MALTIQARHAKPGTTTARGTRPSTKEGIARLIPADAVAEYVALLRSEAEAGR